MVANLKPWLWMPPQLAHFISPYFLRLYARIRPLQTLTWAPFTWRGLDFSNPLGIAGGVDKNAECIDGWWSLGPGFLEVGTVTPLSQSGNSGVVIRRNRKARAVWNRLGFPSKGLDSVVTQIKDLYQPHFTPIFVNIGKNKETPFEKAHDDYIKCIEKVGQLADVFVINISSPNTEGLRDLLKPENLRAFLKPIVAANTEITGLKKVDQATPLLLKISPDISTEELREIIEISLELDISGWVLTNSSLGMREGLDFSTEGGISGRPLARKSKEMLAATLQILGERRTGKLIVSSGGVLSAEDAFERLKMGADLVQVYSALVFEGPLFFRNVAYRASLNPDIKS